MSLSADEVKKIAHLARIAIEATHIPHYTQELSQILDLVAKMDQAATQQVEPMAHPLDINQRVRSDEVTESDQRELFQSIAPQVEAGLYLVPKVIETAE